MEASLYRPLELSNTSLSDRRASAESSPTSLDPETSKLHFRCIEASAPFTVRRVPKYSLTGVTRSVRPTLTIRRVSSLMDKIGVTRIADVTGLDRPGIPNFVAVRPRDRAPGISYYNGKGSNRQQAKAGAMMEAIERYSGELWDRPVCRASFAELSSVAPVVDPDVLQLSSRAEGRGR
jgi:hypothetical protein